MISTTCFQIPRSTFHPSSIKHPQPFSSISFSSAQIKKNKNASNMIHNLFSLSKYSKILAANTNTATEGSSKERAVDQTRNLPAGLKPELMPKHVAVIMDGNRRWAIEKGVPVVEGHRAGAEVMKQLIRLCSELGIHILTTFAFSTENWLRPQVEVDFLMSLFEEVLQSELEESKRNGVRTSIIGDRANLPKSLQKLITRIEEATKHNTKYHLMVALNYSGQQDMLQATKNIARKLRDGMIQLEDINQSLFANELQTKWAEFPNPDLLIRTSGEQRLSNFMLWQLAYTELFFVEKMFPDFEEADFVSVLKSFQKRHRRFGGHKY